ncbi:hypothetical protein NMR47_003429 [Vibrio cholerae]|uniref:hypothetical protein n=1 Tax=Vibrio cholerae TaxID=666 RepID=UPI000E0B7B3B|nr:hypothetical protein [Vibrio cholerae]EJL6318518.1 hypothetical protein [Vibrio cholerae]EKF9306801.1 hypothetical protein [Vibrio cholerae]ELC0993181.1 hypothetical protein [Vibrio cholerae]
MIFDDFIAGSLVVMNCTTLAKNNNVKVQLDPESKNGHFHVTISSNDPIIYNRDTCTIKLESGGLSSQFSLYVSINNQSIFELTGTVSKISHKGKCYSVDQFIYVIPNSADKYFVHNQVSWVSSLGCTFKINSDLVAVYLPEQLSSNDDKFDVYSLHIDERIRFLTTILTFCRSTTVEWESKYSFLKERKVAFDYIKSRSEESFPNQINPLRRDSVSWESFILHCMENEISMDDLVANGVFQAIGNLRWNQTIDEWSLIRLVAALEGLVSSNETIIPESQWKKIRRSFVCRVKEAKSDYGLCDGSVDDIVKNLNNSDRIINQYSIKKRVESCFKQLGLGSYYNLKSVSINNAINSRNSIVHTGWDKDIDEPLWDMIVTLRNSIYLLVMRKLNYNGDFWFCNSDEKQTLAKYV